MPQVIIRVSEDWWQRSQNGIKTAIDTLTGLENQILQSMLHGEPDALDMLDAIHAQLRELRRNLETWRVPF